MPYNKMKLAVGMFVIILFISISTFLYLILAEKGTFDKRYNFHFTTNSANSFSIGMPLKFSGFTIGVIDNIKLQDDGNVYMTFSVTKENRKWISQGSYLLLKKPLIGSAHIEVHSTVGHQPLQEDALLEIKISDDINDMISKLEPVVNNLIDIISDIKKITSKIAKEDSDLFQSMKHLNTFSAKLAKSDSLLTSITGDKNSTKNMIRTLNETTSIMHELHNTAKDLSKLTASLNETLIQPSSKTIMTIQEILDDLKHKLKVLDGTVNSIGSYDQDLETLKNQISVSIEKSNQILDKVDSFMQNDKEAEVTLP